MFYGNIKDILTRISTKGARAVEGYNSNKVIEQQLRQLGVKEGDILLVHASLKSLGQPRVKAEMVIKGIETVLGEKGTLLMPTLTYKQVDGYKNDTFSVKDTESEVGMLSECFRRMPGVVRSLHPTHSVCARGRFANELVATHYMDNTPCGPNSPYRLLKEMGGHILIIGCGLEKNTSMHGVEELVQPEYLFGDIIEYKLYNGNREKSFKKYKTHNFQGITQRYDRLKDILEEEKDIKEITILDAQCYLINARTMWKKAYDTMQKNRYYFVDQL